MDRKRLSLSQRARSRTTQRVWALLLAVPIVVLFEAHDASAQGEVLPCRGATEFTYFPRGDHWAVIPGQTIFYRQQQDGSKDITGAHDLAAINRASATWMTHQCVDGFPNIFIFDGFEENGNMDYPTRDNGDVYDGAGNILSWENIFYWEQNPNEWFADVDLTAALTTNIFLPQTDGMVTADMQFNDLTQFSNGVTIATPFRWRTVTSPGGAPIGCPDGNAKCFDVETVALHELGHFLGLNHVNCSDSVMFPEGSAAAEVVELSRHEERAICAMYPPVPMGLMTERYWMEQCNSNAQCPDGLCVFPQGLEGTIWGYCTSSCSTTSECPEATICATTTGLPGFCKPGPNFTGGAVIGGCGCNVDSSCSPNCGCDPDCAVCTTSAECTGGQICQNGQCTTCSNNGQCTGGQACIGGTCQNCTLNSQCGGLVCSGGSCVNCTLSSECDTGLVCTSGVCTGCSSAAECATGQICSGGLCTSCSSNSQCTGGQVCASGSCQNCTDTNQCSVGAVCSGGSCVGCTDNGDCQNGQVCSGNVCTDCTSNGQCTGGQVCSNGRCGACTGGCTGGQVCVGGACQSCTSSAQCGNGQICSSGSCTGCGSNGDCSGGQVCIVAQCVPCSNDAQCGSQICLGGSCSDCTESSQCPSGRVCNGGSCVPCTGTADCSDGLICVAGSCSMCSNDTQCPNGLVCSGGRCIGCTSASQCGGGQVCVGGECENCTVDAQCPGTQVCGPSGTCESGGGVGTVDPETGLPLDLCTPCTASNQCSTAVCASDGVDSLCSIECYSGSLPQGTPTANGCPEGFDCLPAGNGSVCWPQVVDECGGLDPRADVNEVCYQANLPGESDDVFVPCGPSLVCLDFKPRCAGQEGACVSFCNPDQPCPNVNQTCCYGIDDNGNCLGFDADLGRVFGGCYDIRTEGETCVSAEQSVCELGLGCFNFGDALDSKCFRTCNTQLCGAGTSCFSFTDSCTNSFDLCCDNGNTSVCTAPNPSTNLSPLGAPCSNSAQCDTQICANFDGQSACSRVCNAVTGIGCPNAEFDANGDGIPDGGYQCRSTGTGEDGQCWPNALVMPDPTPDPDPDPINRGTAPKGCAQTNAAMGWLLLVALGFVRRRSKS